MRFKGRLWLLLGVALWFAVRAHAQFSSSVQGTVVDVAGAVIPKAIVTLTNISTKVSAIATVDNSGVFRFTSLAPGDYLVTGTAAGFGEKQVSFRLQTAENRAVTVALPVANVNTSVEVSTQAPILDTADSRLEYTIDQKAVNELPLSTRNPTSIIGITPGVTGALNTQTNLNNAPENFIDASANGRGENGNTYVVDGLDVTSNVRPGVVNLTPGADMVQEESVQTNTYSVEYGRGSGIETRISTKYGTDQFHGFASDYYQYQGFNARGEYGPSHTAQPRLAPYHVNNAAFGLGGPIWRSDKLFFYGTYQPYLRSGSSPTSVTFEDPAFVQFALSARPNTPELQLFQKYPVSGVYAVTSQTAQQVFGAQTSGAATACNTAGSDFIPCTTPVVDTASLNAPSRTEGLQYSGRIDKYFQKDRIYVSAIRNRLKTSSVPARAAFAVTNNFYGIGVQANETHTFSANLLNEAVFAVNRIEGIQPESGTFSVPVVNISGINQGFGSGFAQGDYYQHSYHWRDVVTYIHGNHSFKFGYEGWHGDDTAIFEGPYAQPSFTYTNLINLINSNPYSEGSLSYNPVTGKPQAGNYGYSETTAAAFVQDTWKVNKRVTLNVGLRYDNYGNPYPSLPGVIAAPFVLGNGSTFQERIANGYLRVQSHALNQTINWAFAPRGGVSWDVTGNGKWVFQGGFGTYRDQITVGNMADILKGNPPNWVLPTFFNDGSTAPPVFGFGTSNTYPYGFTYPTYSPVPYDSKGGQPGKAIAIGSVDPNVRAPIAYVWNAGIQHSLGRSLVASAAYVGSHGDDILLAGLNQGANQFGYNVNAFPGDLINTTTCIATTSASTGVTTDKCSAHRTYLNKSFGTINYAYNTAHSNYEALIVALRGRFGRTLNFTASYTRSQSKDDASLYAPTASFDQNRFYGFTPFDVPNRVSVGGSYSTPGLHGRNALIERATAGWTVGGTFTYQTGTPIFVSTNAPYSVSRIDPSLPVSPTNLKYNPGSGDFSASGYNYDLPNMGASTAALNDRAHYKLRSTGGIFPGCQNFATTCTYFTQPSFGQLGNETPNAQFRNPNFAQTDLSLKKTTAIYERLSLDLRVDAFNLFNQVNFNSINSNLNDINFGTALSTHTARYLQVGATASF